MPDARLSSQPQSGPIFPRQSNYCCAECSTSERKRKRKGKGKKQGHTQIVWYKLTNSRKYCREAFHTPPEKGYRLVLFKHTRCCVVLLLYCCIHPYWVLVLAVTLLTGVRVFFLPAKNFTPIYSAHYLFVHAFLFLFSAKTSISICSSVPSALLLCRRGSRHDYLETNTCTVEVWV